jgi:hypothetical protein
MEDIIVLGNHGSEAPSRRIVRGIGSAPTIPFSRQLRELEDAVAIVGGAQTVGSHWSPPARIKLEIVVACCGGGGGSGAGFPDCSPLLLLQPHTSGVVEGDEALSVKVETEWRFFTKGGM